MTKQKVDIKGFESYGMRFEVTASDAGDVVHLIFDFSEKNKIEMFSAAGQMLTITIKK